MQICQLEESLGVPLIETVGGRVEVTGAGKDVEQCPAAAIVQVKDCGDFTARHRAQKKQRRPCRSQYSKILYAYT